MLGFEQLVNQLQRTGHRRLVVLSGDEAWTLSQVTHLRDTLPGDWLWLEENPSKAISGLLGREYLHAVFDARDGFDVSAFAALSGTLRAGSLLMLLVPQEITAGLTGMNLLQTAMQYHLGGFGTVFIAATLALFSFSTFLGVLYYARSNVAYLCGDNWWSQTVYA